MNLAVEVISFIIWIIYFYLLVSREIDRKNNNKDKYNFALLKKNIFYLIRIDSLFFLITFYIYKGFRNTSVSIYMYFVIIMASLVFIVYENSEKIFLKNIKVKKELKYYLASSILLLIPFIYLMITKNVTNACLYTLLMNFLVPIFIYLIKLIRKLWYNVNKGRK